MKIQVNIAGISQGDFRVPLGQLGRTVFFNEIRVAKTTELTAECSADRYESTSLTSAEVSVPIRAGSKAEPAAVKQHSAASYRLV